MSFFRKPSFPKEVFYQESVPFAYQKRKQGIFQFITELCKFLTHMSDTVSQQVGQWETCLATV